MRSPPSPGYWPFFLPIAVVPVAFVVLMALDGPMTPAADSLRTYLRSAATVMVRGDVFVMFLASLRTFVLIYGAYLTFLPFLLVQTFDTTPLGIGVIFAAGSVSSALVSFSLGRIAKVVGERWLVASGFVLYVMVMVATPRMATVWQQVVVVTVFGVAIGLSIPSILSVLSGTVPERYRAAVMSVNGMLLRLGQALRPLVAGAAYAALGLAAPFDISAILAAGMLVPLLWTAHRHAGGRS